MKPLTIGEVARQTGFAPSTLRYYETVGLIQPAGRVNRQRRYHPEIINRLAVIETAQQVGFSVAFTGKLLDNFEKGSYPIGSSPGSSQPDEARSGDVQPERWEKLAWQKMAELDRLIAQARQMQEILGQLIDCECPDLNECGLRLLAQGTGANAGIDVSVSRKHRKPAAKA